MSVYNHDDKIRVIIVDDHAMVRRGLRALLSTCNDIEVVGEADGGSSALKIIEQLHPEIVLLDLRLQGPDGIEVSCQILHSFPDTKIILVTAFDDEDSMLQALQLGVYAYLQKTTADEEIIETIRLVHQGQHFLSQSQIDPLLRQFQFLSKKYAYLEFSLSQMDIELLQMMARGLSSSQIADETFWSERTVKRRIRDIVEKLQVTNRTEAIVEAIKRGLI